MTHPVIVILAAGASSRMGGRDKLLEPVQGGPLLRVVAERALGTGAPVVAVLPPDRPARNAALGGAALGGAGLAIVTAQDAAQGMAASLRAGIVALPPQTTGAMILPADMPGITTEDMATLLSAHAAAPHAILRGATGDGRLGHPVLFPADLFPELMRQQGDEGGRSVLRAHAARLRALPLPGDHAVLDLDTPQDWENWRASGCQ